MPFILKLMYMESVPDRRIGGQGPPLPGKYAPVNVSVTMYYFSYPDVMPFILKLMYMGTDSTRQY